MSTRRRGLTPHTVTLVNRQESSFQITAASYAHPHTPAEVRTALALDDEQLAAAYARIRHAGIDAFVLTTCLRVEVVAVGCERALGRVEDLLFGDIPREPRIVRQNEAALRHLYRIAAGLDSPIVGEPEVFGQFRDAVETAVGHDVTGGVLEKVLQQAISVGRATRKALPTTGPGSLALVAAELADGHRQVAVFGAGAMARAAVQALGDRSVTLYARRPEAVTDLPVEVRHLSEAPEALARADMVVSATAAKSELFAADVLSEAVRARPSPLLLVDLAMPPDFRPPATPANLTYVNIDDLADHARRLVNVEDAEHHIEKVAGEHWAKLANHATVGPVIAAILQESDTAVAEVVDRFANRLGASADERRLLEQMAHTIAHRVLHRPLSYLSRDEHGSEAAPLLAEIFGVAQ